MPRMKKYARQYNSVTLPDPMSKRDCRLALLIYQRGLEQQEEGAPLPRSAQRALDKIARHNMRMIYSVAPRYINSCITMDELISAGHMTLMRCARMYKAELGWAFSTYFQISLQRELAIVVGRTIKHRKRFTTVHLFQDEQVTREHDFDEKERLAGVEVSSGTVSLFKIVDETLPPRKQDIFRRRYINGDSCQTIGEDVGMSKQRVQQITAAALSDIKDRVEELGYRYA